MYSKDDILKMLRDGADAEALASSFVDALNAATDEYQAEAKSKEGKMEIAERIHADFVELLTKYYPTFAGSADGFMSAQSIVAMMDDAVDAYNTFEQFGSKRKEDWSSFDYLAAMDKAMERILNSYKHKH